MTEDPLLELKANDSLLETIQSKPEPEAGSNKSANLTWSQRTFGPMKPGSLRVGIFTLLSCTLGVGMFVTPYVFERIGLINGIFIVIVPTCLSLQSMKLLIISADDPKHTNFTDIALILLGKKPAYFLEILLILDFFMTIILCPILINDLVGSILNDFKINKAIYSALQVTIPTTIISAFLGQIISLKKELFEVRWISLFSVIGILYLILVVIFEAPFQIAENWNYSNLNYFIWNGKEILLGQTLIQFCVINQMQIFPIKSELQNPEKRRMFKIVDRSQMGTIFVLLFVGILGYFSFLKDLPKLFVIRKSLQNAFDLFMLLGKIALILEVWFMIVMNAFPCRLHLMHLFGRKEISKCANIIITFLIIFLAHFLAAIQPKISVFFSVLGGGTGTLITFLYPSLMQVSNNIKQTGRKWSLKNITVIAFAIAVLGIGISGAIYSFIIESAS